jgi:hypothetical protein
MSWDLYWMIIEKGYKTRHLVKSCMEQSPFWKADRSSASQENARFYGTWRFTTTFTRSCHWSLCWGSHSMLQTCLNPLKNALNSSCLYL